MKYDITLSKQAFYDNYEVMACKLHKVISAYMKGVRMLERNCVEIASTDQPCDGVTMPQPFLAVQVWSADGPMVLVAREASQRIVDYVFEHGPFSRFGADERPGLRG